MNYTDLATGTRLEIIRLDNERPDGRQLAAAGLAPVYVSQLLEPAQDRQLLIAVPISGFRLIPWEPGCRMKVTFIQKTRGIWTFTACLLRQRENNRVAAWEIAAEDDLSRLQRREWYRLPCSLDLSCRPTRAESAAATVEKPDICYSAITRDISGGGLAIVTEMPVQESAEVEITLNLDNQKPIVAHGRVVRVGETGNPAQQSRLITLQFTDIAARDQNDLIKFVLRRQVNLQRQLREKQQL